MTGFSALNKRATNAIVAAGLVLASAVPILVFGQVGAAQLTSRYVRMSSSVVSETDVIYDVGFTVTTTGNIQGVVIDFCSDSPLVGQTCTAPTGFDIAETTLALTEQTGLSGFTINAASDTNTIIITNAAGGSVSASTAVEVDFGSNSSNGLTNPSTLGTFYARILTYAVEADAAAYTPTVPGSYTDDGGVALSTARQLTVNARVQEQLEFCVGAILNTVIDASTTPANCAAFPTETTIDLGPIDSTGASVSPVLVAAGGNSRKGGVMIRTNAVNGAVVSYFAEQETSSGRLKVPGATCSGSTGTFDAGSSVTDQCFNSNADQDHADNVFSVAGEKFGMTIPTILRPTGSTTTNLTQDAEYDGDGTATGLFAWDQSGTNDPATTIASSSSVLDYEMAVLHFAARTAATTPTGAYSVTSTYIATATF